MVVEPPVVPPITIEPPVILLPRARAEVAFGLTVTVLELPDPTVIADPPIFTVLTPEPPVVPMLIVRPTPVAVAPPICIVPVLATRVPISRVPAVSSIVSYLLIV